MERLFALKYVMLRYQICIRRESGKCYICYSPTASRLNAMAVMEANQDSFGLR